MQWYKTLLGEACVCVALALSAWLGGGDDGTAREASAPLMCHARVIEPDLETAFVFADE